MENKKMINYFKKIDWIIVVSSVFLTLFGLLSIYSSSLARGNFLTFKKQIFFLLLGLVLMFVFALIDWRDIYSNLFLILAFYFIAVFLLLGLIFFGSPIRGIKGWYEFGIFAFDPIEFLKIILIILLARYFSKKHIEMYRLKHILISGIYVAIPSILIIAQPNLGSAMILIILWIGILVFSGIKINHLLLLLLIFIIIFCLGWFLFLKDYQKLRIISFIFPERDPLGIGWSQRQAKIAIGSGGVLGQGFIKGSQTRYGFLPEPQTDFIFSAIGEEYGLAGISILFFLYFVLVYRIIKIAKHSFKNFARLFACSFAILLIVQFFINIGMNISILPVIGVSLPFVSYGGSGLLMFFSALGVIQNIKINS